MNRYSISDDKLELFLFLTCEITKIRQGIPSYTPIPGGKAVIDYKNHPDECAKITLIVDYINKHITTNKSQLKRALGTVYDFYSSWKMLCSKTEKYKIPYNNLGRNNTYIQFLLGTFSKEIENKKLERLNNIRTRKSLPEISSQF